ncbi:MAG TPA: NAD(P)-dependent oxidoreductase [Mycobacterium sp.]|jgi:nucleoside-diphosphate-sugar epimerase|nr:NAD(P)-dependent oxidoreductase [Mycobacterium sp.]
MLVLITGAAGRIGTMVRPRLRAEGVSLRLMDVVAPTDIQDGEETIVGSVTDRRGLTDAMHGVDAVVHLAGIAVEAAWDDILEANVTGTQSVLQSAVDAGVTRLVLASSNHAAGFWPHRRPQSGDFPPTSRPDPTPSTAGARPPGKPWPGSTTTDSASTWSRSGSDRVPPSHRMCVHCRRGCRRGTPLS